MAIESDFGYVAHDAAHANIPCEGWVCSYLTPIMFNGQGNPQFCLLFRGAHYLLHAFPRVASGGLVPDGTRVIVTFSLFSEGSCLGTISPTRSYRVETTAYGGRIVVPFSTTLILRENDVDPVLTFVDPIGCDVYDPLDYAMMAIHVTPVISNPQEYLFEYPMSNLTGARVWFQECPGKPLGC